MAWCGWQIDLVIMHQNGLLKNAKWIGGWVSVLIPNLVYQGAVFCFLANAVRNKDKYTVAG